MAAGGTSKQVLPLNSSLATSVTIDYTGKGLAPYITALTFSRSGPIHPLQPVSCTSSSEGPQHSCSMLYDGLATSWQPALNESSGKTKDSPEWVEIEFSSKQAINRMWFRHGQKPRPAPTPAPIPAAMVGNGEKGKAYDQLDGADDNRDGNWDGDDDSDSGSDSDGYGDKDLFDDDEEEWVETAARASGEASGINLMKLGKNPPPLPPQSFTVMYDDGSAYRQVVQFPRGNPDDLGFVGGPTTLQLPQGTTKRVRLLVPRPRELIFTEVLFWDAKSVPDAEWMYPGNHKPDRLRQRLDVNTGAATDDTRPRSHQKNGDMVQAQVGCGGDPAVVAAETAVLEASEAIAMGSCLKALDVGLGLVDVAQGSISGMAAVLINTLDAAMATMGPHFMQILEFYMSGSFSALQLGKEPLDFKLTMWLFGLHVELGFKTIFNIVDLVEHLFHKVTDALKQSQ